MDTSLNLSSRIYIQYRPDTASLNRLKDLQNRLKTDTTSPVTARELHLSILHVGKLDKMLDKLRALGKVSERDYLDVFAQILTGLEELHLPPELTFESRALQSFGYNGTLLVLGLVETEELKEIRLRCVELVKVALHRLNLDVAHAFSTIPDLKNALHYTPHIALLRGDHEIQEMRLPHQITLELGPLLQSSRLA